jgi:hypothetical protein
MCLCALSESIVENVDPEKHAPPVNGGRLQCRWPIERRSAQAPPFELGKRALFLGMAVASAKGNAGVVAAQRLAAEISGTTAPKENVTRSSLAAGINETNNHA